ncbi:MAG: hypothetical protein Q8L39_06475 [Burkholderiales bacterium]|nr:hypothetical protein [Burkholderiales bacterium]
MQTAITPPENPASKTKLVTISRFISASPYRVNNIEINSLPGNSLVGKLIDELD